ncbi:MAG: ATP-binding protein, partial [Pseudomonadota bacterium]
TRLRIAAARMGARVESAGAPDSEKFEGIAAEVCATKVSLRIDCVETDPRWSEVAREAQVSGALLGIPLDRKGHVIGVLIVGRGAGMPVFSDAEESLVGTFAGQAAAAIENARLYEEVRAFSEELEAKVEQRTRELTTANVELERTIAELCETQAQLVLSERMAGLGALVAGIAHEINSPSAAIRGSVDALAQNVRRLSRSAREIGQLELDDQLRTDLLVAVEELAPQVAGQRVVSPATVRRQSRDLSARMAAAGLDGCEECARILAELGVGEEALGELLSLFAACPRGSAITLVGYLQEHVCLHRNAWAIGTAIKQIQRIVGALKSYSHLDQAKLELADIHEGIENTLVILHHQIKYGISIVRQFGVLPRVPVYVDELNQVWTNLIHNAVQALGGRGEVVIETSPPEPGEKLVVVRIVDNGPGIPPEVLPRIFEPFFTTKPKGEGAGLGLGVVRKIVSKHAGEVTVSSVPGRTCFAVSLPVEGPADAAAGASPSPSASASVSASVSTNKELQDGTER